MIPRHLPILLLLLPILGSGSGCVALNLPSERYDDPGAPADRPRAIDDIFLWASPQDGGAAAAAIAAPQDLPAEQHPPHHGKLPDVPWPRFHPLPTCPVY